ncbi:MAG: response regulator [Chloroflexi bacterium]|jgi:DNA-binding response OmpR family regulator|nr:response regulator [Chloroflexota bacterium]
MANVRILIVDERRSQVGLIQAVLQRDGYEVYMATDGTEGLEEARRIKPHVAIVNAVLPGMSGYEVCRQLKSDPVTAKTAVLMLVASSEVEGEALSSERIAAEVRNRLRAFDVGALDLITEPVKATDLSKRVKTLLWSGGIGEL